MQTYKTTVATLLAFCASMACDRENSDSDGVQPLATGTTATSSTIENSAGSATAIATSAHLDNGESTPSADAGTSGSASSSVGLSSASVPSSHTASSAQDSGVDSGSPNSDSSTAASSAGSDTPACAFSVGTNEISSKMATVGVVEWSVAGGTPTRAQISYALSGDTAALLNTGGKAPVDLSKPNYRTLLLGLKQSRDYTFRIEAELDGEMCTSELFTLPTTGVFAGAPDTLLNVDQPQAREPGFILTTGGYLGTGAFILDADGALVWYSEAPTDPGRIRMDYAGENMWMMALNPLSGAGVAGELRRVSMDGQIVEKNIPGFTQAHHDFTVTPDGKAAAPVWRLDLNATDFETNDDPESDLVIRSPDGTLETAFKIGSNLYASEGKYHCNAIHYIEADDSFTISDRTSDLVVKVSATGEVQWQLGGSCTGAPAGAAKCSAQTWLRNHGHQLLEDGTFLVFNNGEGGGNAHVLEFQVTATPSGMTAELTKDYEGTQYTSILGDVQRLPGGNTLITYGTAGEIVEVDSAWNIVQTFTGDFGYADWRPTLYGAPTRL